LRFSSVQKVKFLSFSSITANLTKLFAVEAGLPSIDSILDELELLPQYKNFTSDFRDNYNSLVLGCANLRDYIITWKDNLDYTFINDDCTELYDWYLDFLAQLQEFRIKINDVKESCVKGCPNERFVYNADACECSCALTCTSSQKPDLINCQVTYSVPLQNAVN